MTELITIEQQTALEVYSAEGGLNPAIDKLRSIAGTVHADLSTAKSRKKIASMAYAISRSKTYIQKLGSELAAAKEDEYRDLLTVRNAIKSEMKRAGIECDKLRDEVRAPLNEWESEQAAIKTAHNAKVDEIRGLAAALPGASSEQLNESLESLARAVDIDPRFSGEQAEKIHVEIDRATATVTAALHQAVEFERLQAAEAKAIAEAAEAKAIAEAKAAAKEEAERTASAVLKAKAEAIAETKRTAEQAEAKAAAKIEKLEKDKAVRGRVHKSIKEDLMASAGLSEDAARAVVISMIEGIKHVKINYEG